MPMPVSATSMTMPGLPSRSASNDRSASVPPSGMAWIALTIRLISTCCSSVRFIRTRRLARSSLHHADFRLVQEMLHQRQAVRHDASGRMALDIAGILFRPGKLQQLGDDLADAMDLLVEQAELDLGLVGLVRRSRCG